MSVPNYKIPPTLDPNFERDLRTLANIIVENRGLIAQKLFANAISNAGIVSPTISTSSLIKLIDTIIIPTMQKFEGGWSDHPNDSGGATMRGVILTTFVSSFDSLFINTEIAQVRNAARQFNTRYPGWKNDPSKGKQALYVIAGYEDIASLWIVKFFCSSSCRYPIAIMTEDPILGYLIAEFCWGSGAGMFESNKIDDLARQFGWNGNKSQFAQFCTSLGNQSPLFTTNVFQARLNFILNISKPGSPNAVFRKGWLNRLINDPNDSKLATIVKINELFNLNTKGIFSFSTQELAHLKVKAEIYKTFKIDIP